MLRFAPALLFTLALGCAAPPGPAPTTTLVPGRELVALFPDSVGRFQPKADTVYRGYFGEAEGEGFGLITAARVYEQGVVQLGLNLSSTDDASRYVSQVVAGVGRPAPDSLLAADSTFQRAIAAGWSVYEVQYGWLLVGHGRAVEAKSLVSAEAAREALQRVDLDRLAALEAVPVEVDSSFVRVVD